MVRLCRMRQAYGMPMTGIVSCKSNLQLAYDCHVRHKKCRMILNHVLKSYDNRRYRLHVPVCWMIRFVCDFCMTRAVRALEIACDSCK